MMRPSMRLILAIGLAAAVIGLIDSAITNEWDLFVIFLVVAVVQAGLLVGSAGNRVFVSLRPDLARWAQQRSQRTGEPLDDVVDRALAWFQHGLYQPEDPDG